MSFKKKALLGVILASSATMSLQAFASPYIGASLGQSDYDAVEDGTSYELKAGYKFSTLISVTLMIIPRPCGHFRLMRLNYRLLVVTL